MRSRHAAVAVEPVLQSSGDREALDIGQGSGEGPRRVVAVDQRHVNRGLEKLKIKIKTSLRVDFFFFFFFFFLIIVIIIFGAKNREKKNLKKECVEKEIVKKKAGKARRVP